MFRGNLPSDFSGLPVLAISSELAWNSPSRRIKLFWIKNYKLSGYLCDFHLSAESNLRLLWFCIASFIDWLKKLAPLSQPIRSKTKATRGSLAQVFPRFVSATCYCFEFWLDERFFFASFVIGQSNYSSFGYTTLQWKTAAVWKFAWKLDCDISEKDFGHVSKITTGFSLLRVTWLDKK